MEIKFASMDPVRLMRTIEPSNSVSYVLPSAYSSTISDLSSEYSGSSVMDNEDVVMQDAEYAYAKCYPSYDVFSKQPLIDNGYIEHAVGDLMPYNPGLSPITATTFATLSLPDVHVD
ncbi:uncharacterized protein LACBIDRAFT_336161 [Laccaria bicolor S238N-H82]|uniref:Predicted protein n=1 Tax=Laccaria bicolor (strain S238N-H82 / ATCC MYA-4686) TaxID=486041 RepID=B0E4K7_LACBS|nr:uncharacterized protein LACBIDRAFT_336161 [Laccaria bicolor S238N-H82]EDQ98224.1 predicted protein [Laccaria bicolor S238N-H82]|eukprot:XP_001891125.1 predicted protein [Laccaria bicolor S238N-H82]